MNSRFLFLAAALSLPVAAQAAGTVNFVKNGDFEQTSTTSANGSFQVSAGNPYGTLTSWTTSNSPTTGGSGPFNLLFTTGLGANATDTSATAGSPSNPSSAIPTGSNQYGGGQYLASGYNETSPTGGNFVALDGDINVNGYLSQTITGLSAGSVYELDFYWAAAQIATRTGNTSDSLQVNFGNSVVTTPVESIASNGFSGWMKQTYSFTATSTSQVLSFLSIGAPAGYPPVALLDGVSLVAAPEPSTLAVLAVGLGGMVAFGSRRRRTRAA